MQEEQTMTIEDIKNKLTDLIDEYFPKINKFEGNPGRGEAMVIVGFALAEFDKYLTQELAQAKKAGAEEEKARINNYRDIILGNITDDEELEITKNRWDVFVNDSDKKEARGRLPNTKNNAGLALRNPHKAGFKASPEASSKPKERNERTHVNLITNQAWGKSELGSNPN